MNQVIKLIKRYGYFISLTYQNIAEPSLKRICEIDNEVD